MAATCRDRQGRKQHAYDPRRRNLQQVPLAALHAIITTEWRPHVYGTRCTFSMYSEKTVQSLAQCNSRSVHVLRARASEASADKQQRMLVLTVPPHSGKSECKQTPRRPSFSTLVSRHAGMCM